MLVGKSSFRTIKKIIRCNLDFRSTNLNLLLVLSVTVLTSAVPLALLLHIYLARVTCLIITATWSVCVIICMYAGYVYPELYAILAEVD